MEEFAQAISKQASMLLHTRRVAQLTYQSSLSKDQIRKPAVATSDREANLQQSLPLTATRHIPAPIELLPVEILESVLSLLPIPCLYSFAQTCHTLHNLVIKNHYLRYICATEDDITAVRKFSFHPTTTRRQRDPSPGYAVHHTIASDDVVFAFGKFSPHAWIKYCRRCTLNPFERESTIVVNPSAVALCGLAFSSIVYPFIPKLTLHLGRLHPALEKLPLEVLAADKIAVTFNDIHAALYQYTTDLKTVAKLSSQVFSQATHYSFSGISWIVGTEASFQIVNGWRYDFGISRGEQDLRDPSYWPPRGHRTYGQGGDVNMNVRVDWSSPYQNFLQNITHLNLIGGIYSSPPPRINRRPNPNVSHVLATASNSRQ